MTNKLGVCSCDEMRAQEIISQQWADVLAATDGNKTFMEVFDDAFTTTIDKTPEKYICSLNDNDVLCRMVKEKECDEQRFIPWPESSSQNRWNPPGKSFLYMSYGKGGEHAYNSELSLEQRVCLLETRTEPNTDCSFCYFKPTVPGRIFDLSYNDTKLEDHRRILNDTGHRIVSSVLERMLDDATLAQHVDDKSYVYSQIKHLIKPFDIDIKTSTEEFIMKQYLQILCDCIYTRVDGSDAEKEQAYQSFHTLAQYLQAKGITGIIYPCTRDEQINGKNIVLFEPNDAQPINGSIIRYHYTGDRNE